MTTLATKSRSYRLFQDPASTLVLMRDRIRLMSIPTLVTLCFVLGTLIKFIVEIFWEVNWFNLPTLGLQILSPKLISLLTIVLVTLGFLSLMLDIKNQLLESIKKLALAGAAIIAGLCAGLIISIFLLCYLIILFVVLIIRLEINSTKHTPAKSDYLNENFLGGE